MPRLNWNLQALLLGEGEKLESKEKKPWRKERSMSEHTQPT